MCTTTAPILQFSLAFTHGCTPAVPSSTPLISLVISSPSNSSLTYPAGIETSPYRQSRCFTRSIMEGLGIAANVIAVVDLAAKACGAVYKYAKSAKGCPKTVAQLQKELESVQKSLDGLYSIADKLEAAVPSGEQSPRISQLSGALRECQTTLGALIEDLEGHFRNKFREKLGRQLKWPMKEPEVIEFIERLHRYQQIFLQALQADLA